MKRMDISKKQLLEGVKSFEKQELMSDFLEADEINEFYIFKSRRKKKLTIISTSKIPSADLKKSLENANIYLNKHLDFSDTVEIFTTASISLYMKGKLKEDALNEGSLNVLIFDIDDMLNYKEFDFLKNEEKENSYDNLVQRALYDYMTLGAESNDIKMRLYQSVLLLQIYKHSPIAPSQLIEETNTKFGRGADNIRRDLDELRRNQRVVASKTQHDMVELSEEETLLIKESLKTAQEEENIFMSRFEQIIIKYKIEFAKESIFKLLQKINKTLYEFNQAEESQINVDEEIEQIIGLKSKFSVSELVQDLQSLCYETDFLRRQAANQSFVDLYKDEKYEEYVNSRPNLLFLDTPTFAYYLCFNSSFEDECVNKWDDPDYQSVCDLIRFANAKSSKIQICVPGNYVGETIGEMKKAIRIAWFYDELDIDFPISTSNTFFNFYKHVRSEKEMNGEDVTNFSIKVFLSEFGCKFDVDDYNFSIPIEKFINTSAAYYNFMITYVRENYEEFQAVKDEYKSRPKVGRKTPKAIDNDIRQAFYILKECNLKDQDYYLVSWDSTLFGLRDIVSANVTKCRSYVIGTPSRILNRLSLKYFKLHDVVETREAFAYADKQFKIMNKISSLFDNVLSPLFASSSKKNSALIKQLLKLQSQDLDKDYGDKAYKDTRLRLENIFSNIEDILPNISCTWQNLKDFLNNESNNDFVYEIIKNAYSANRDYLSEEDTKAFSSQIRAFVDKDDVEVKL